jgi:hypothetical protein
VLTLPQLTVPLLAYVLAWRAADRAEQVLDRLARICLLGLGLVTVLLVAETVLGGLPGLELSVRPVAISLAVMFVVATINARSWRRTMAIGVSVVLIAGLTGSRMSSAVLMVLLLCTPSLAVSFQWRVAVELLVVLLVQLSQTEAFKTRFFFDSAASLTDVLMLSPKLNTAGRRQAWPALMEACSDAPGHRPRRGRRGPDRPVDRQRRLPPAPQRLPAHLRRHGSAGQHPVLGVLPRRRGALRRAGGPGPGPPAPYSAPCGGRVASDGPRPVRGDRQPRSTWGTS